MSTYLYPTYLSPVKALAHPTWLEYPYIARNTTTGKLYAYTHIPEWSGVEHNFFKVEGKQKRIPAAGFEALADGVVVKVEGVEEPKPDLAAPLQLPLSIYQTVQDLEAAITYSQMLTARLEALRNPPVPAPKIRILPMPKLVREHLGIPAWATYLVPYDPTQGRAEARNAGEIGTSATLVDFNMLGYDRINLVEWD